MKLTATLLHRQYTAPHRTPVSQVPALSSQATPTPTVQEATTHNGHSQLHPRHPGHPGPTADSPMCTVSIHPNPPSGPHLPYPNCPRYQNRCVPDEDGNNNGRWKRGPTAPPLDLTDGNCCPGQDLHTAGGNLMPPCPPQAVVLGVHGSLQGVWQGSARVHEPR